MDRFDELLFLVEKTSKKEQHRIDKFLKRHNYDPKTGTIETDEVGKDGKKLRVKFNVNNGAIYDAYAILPDKIREETISMPRKILKRKPMISETILKHEEGHLDYNRNPNKYKELYDKTKKALENDNETYKGDHGSDPEEYVADAYAIKHSKYGIDGFNKTMNVLFRQDADIEKRIRKINKRLAKNPPRSSEMAQEKKELREIKERISFYRNQLSEIKKFTRSKLGQLPENLERAQKMIKDREISIMTLEKQLKDIEERLKDATEFHSKGFEKRKMQVDADKYRNSSKISNKEIDFRKKMGNEIKESTDLFLDIYEAEYNGDITPEERDILVNYLNEKY